MLLEQEREDVVGACRELAAAGLVVGTSGNVSVRAGDLVVVSPSGVDYAELTAELVGVHWLDGRPAEAPLQPTSEMPLHLGIYAATDVAAIVHTHPVAATALSTITDELPAIHYQVAMFGGPVAVAPYATYGSDELARNVVTALRDRTACLMANHGAVTTGPDLRSALAGSRYLEWLCEVYLRALAASVALAEGDRPQVPRLLPADEIVLVAGQLAGYGQRVTQITAAASQRREPPQQP
jgi:L-fuculose-phosphate aldolase